MDDLSGGLHGAFLRADLISEIGHNEVRAALTTGRLIAYSRKVIVDRDRILGLQTRAAAALLHVVHGSCLTGMTAAALWGCTAADSSSVHVLTSYQRPVRARPGLKVHSGTLDGVDSHVIAGLTIVGLDMAIAEVLCTGYRSTALACVDQALALTAPPQRAELHAAIKWRIDTRRDPRGRRRAQALLGLASGRTESPMESAVLVTLFDADLPVPSVQVPVVDLRGRERYRLDFAWEEARIALEYDGFDAHEDREEADAERDRYLAARGWWVVRMTAKDLRDPSRVINDLRAAFAARRIDYPMSKSLS